jgi:capsular exopolysaccharide synthesis family protein
MSTPHRSHRPRRQSVETQDFEDFDEGDQADPGLAHQHQQEKIRMLAFELLGRWYWVMLGLVLGILAATYSLSKTPRQYTATTAILVKEQTASVMARDQIESIDMRSVEAMNTVAERIRRMDLLERVAARQDVRALPGLIPSAVDWKPAWLAARMGESAAATQSEEPPPPASLGGMISGWLNVSIRRGTRLLDISVTHPVPEVTKALADAVAREYLAEIASARMERSGNSIDLLQKQSEEARAKLQLARGSLAIYARAIEVHKTLDAKEAEVAGLQRRYLPKHPKMVIAADELKQLQGQFLREFDVARQAANEKAYWDGVSKELPDPKNQAEEYLRVARQQLLARIGVLESETQSSTLVFNSMLTRIEESSVNQDSSESSAEISNLARVPGDPSSPNARKMITTGAMSGLVGGLLLALLLARLDNKYHTVSQIAVEKGVTILAAIADISPRHLVAAEREFLKRHPDDKRDFHKDWDERVLFRPGVSGTSYAEMYRVLLTSVSLLGDETKRKVTLFSSALPGEGKTITSANFALAAAGQGRKTILIDLDLRRPAVHHVFGIESAQAHSGATECLANRVPFEQSVITDTGVDNLHLMLSGKRTPNPGELLSTGRLNAMLDEACSQYDVVVVDTAPLLAVPDTRIIAPLADNFCLVCRAEYVPKGAVRRVLQVIEEDGTPLSGIIFNAFVEKRRLMGENYSYGYYKTSRYGRAYRYGYGSYGTYGSDNEKS